MALMALGWLWWRALVARLVPRPRWDAAAFVAGVALVRSTFTLCAGVALDEMDRHFAW